MSRKEAQETWFVNVLGGMGSQEECDERSPSPRPSPPRRGRTNCSRWTIGPPSLQSLLSWSSPEKRAGNCAGSHRPNPDDDSPSPGGEGRGEGGCKVKSPFPATLDVRASSSTENIEEAETCAAAANLKKFRVRVVFGNQIFIAARKPLMKRITDGPCCDRTSRLRQHGLAESQAISLHREVRRCCREYRAVRFRCLTTCGFPRGHPQTINRHHGHHDLRQDNQR